MNKQQLKNLLQKHNLKPNKTMGQNFLIDNNVLEEIIGTADLNKNDIVLEIGPGLGILTKKLAEKSKKVIAIEKDKQITGVLKKELENYNNIEIIHGDILEILKDGVLERWSGTALQSYILAQQGCANKAAPSPDFSKTQSLNSYKIVANIPYYLTSHLIRMLLELENQPEEITLLIQKEVAQRICISSPKMNLLAISVQFYGKPKIISYIPKENFWPEPKVDSAIIKITDIRKPENINIKKFFKLVKAGFSSPRKQLINNLSQNLSVNKEEIKKALTECNLNIQARAENLSIKDWICLTSPDGHDPNRSDHLRTHKNGFGG